MNICPFKMNYQITPIPQVLIRVCQSASRSIHKVRLFPARFCRLFDCFAERDREFGHPEEDTGALSLEIDSDWWMNLAPLLLEIRS